MRVLASDIGKHVQERVALSGWAHHIRDLGAICFVLLRDRSGIAQLVFQDAPQFGHESIIRVAGVVVANAKASAGYEVQVEEVEALSTAERDLPLSPHRLREDVGLEALLDHRMLSLRAPRIQAVFRIQAAIIAHFCAYLRREGFTEIKSSKLIASGTEGGTGLFSVDYFGKKVYLAQSPQFYKQALVASGMERVFEVGAAYRAEKHDTPRHLNEYVSLDVEMGFVYSVDELIDVEIGILEAICAGVHVDCGEDIRRYGFSVPYGDQFVRAPRIEYKQAIDIIASSREGRGAGDRHQARERNAPVLDINPEGERILTEWAEEHYDIDAIFITGFPVRKRPFYTLPAETGDASTGSASAGSASFDFLFRGLEMTTGGLRIHDPAHLANNIAKFGLDVNALSDYMQIFRYGAPPHGGFAIGLERLTQKFCNLKSVKEAALFPRDRSRSAP